MDKENTLLPLSVIRTDTVLSRYPIHNLAKTGEIDIEIQRKNENGEIDVRWEVSHNSKYGHPRQLAYKLDTIVVNRHIEEAGRPIPEIIRLGSLRDIATQLGLSHHDSQTLKRAFRQNAFVGISAKLQYKDRRGFERTLEADFTRYDVIFTGEELPDGRKADAVHLILSRVHREVLNNAPARPLDYDYLKALSPASQRFYEIVSYRIFAALTHKLPTADIAYSEYCIYSAQERYFTWEQVKKQIYKLHQPHLKSGYIERVSHEATTDADGKADWVLKYIPGLKAKAEYKTFNSTKQRECVKTIDVATESVISETSQPKPEQSTPTLTDEQKHFVKELIERFSVHEDTAIKLVTTRLEQVAHQLELYPHRQHSRIKDPAAYIIRAIERNYSPPTGYQEQKAQKERKEEETKVKALEQTHRGHQEAHYAAWIHYLGQREAEVKETHQEAYRAFGQCSIIEREQFASSSKPKIREMQEKIYDRTDSHLNRFHKYFKDYPGCEVLDFWTWDSRINPTPFEK
jgi:hypothetical protein